MKKSLYIIELKNGKFAYIEQEISNHGIIHEVDVDDFFQATMFDTQKEVEDAIKDINVFNEYGYGTESHNSKWMYHGDCIEAKGFRELEVVLKESKMNKYMRNAIHDCHYDIKGFVPTEEQIVVIANQIPENTKLLAEQWGWRDTEVREQVYCFIRDKIKAVHDV